MAVVALVTLFAGMNFVIKMAGGAGHAGRGIEYRFDMTIGAGNGLMRSVQQKFGVPVMVKASGWPLIVRMTVAAICAVMTIVVIVFQVATDTFRVHFIGKRIRAVTILARQQGVTPEQRKICIAIVIETRISPGNRIVTIFALLSAAAFVCIIGGMTAVAGFRRVLEDLVFVTVNACNIRVIANQGIVC